MLIGSSVAGSTLFPEQMRVSMSMYFNAHQPLSKLSKGRAGRARSSPLTHLCSTSAGRGPGTQAEMGPWTQRPSDGLVGGPDVQPASWRGPTSILLRETRRDARVPPSPEGRSQPPTQEASLLLRPRGLPRGTRLPRTDRSGAQTPCAGGRGAIVGECACKS